MDAQEGAPTRGFGSLVEGEGADALRNGDEDAEPVVTNHLSVASSSVSQLASKEVSPRAEKGKKFKAGSGSSGEKSKGVPIAKKVDSNSKSGKSSGQGVSGAAKGRQQPAQQLQSSASKKGKAATNAAGPTAKSKNKSMAESAVKFADKAGGEADKGASEGTATLPKTSEESTSLAPVSQEPIWPAACPDDLDDFNADAAATASMLLGEEGPLLADRTEDSAQQLPPGNVEAEELVSSPALVRVHFPADDPTAAQPNLFENGERRGTRETRALGPSARQIGKSRLEVPSGCSLDAGADVTQQPLPPDELPLKIKEKPKRLGSDQPRCSNPTSWSQPMHVVTSSVRRQFGISQKFGNALVLEELVVFPADRQDLLRASRVNAVLQNGARIMAQSEGSAHTYAMSEKVDEICAFISHNWVVPRLKKYLCLILHFNYNYAFIAAVLTMFVVSAFTWYEIFPIIGVTYADGHTEHRGIVATIVTCPSFMLVLFFGHEFMRMFRIRGPTVFLDKTCIHQVDKTLQREGIEKLGAFIRASKKMVVIYTDIYLVKLWTIYEIACFLSMHDPDNLVIVPTFSPLVILGGIFALYCGVLVHVGLSVTITVGAYGRYLAHGIGVFVMAWIFRQWARTKDAIHERMENFRVDKCTCFVEEDRPIVYRNIAILMRATGAVDDTSTDNEALHAFNLLVRRSLSKSLISSVGHLGLGYRHVVVVFMCTYIPERLDYTQGYLEYNTRKNNYTDDLESRLEVARHTTCWLLTFAIWVFGCFPACAACLSIWCSFFLNIKGWQEKVYLFFGGLASMCLAAAMTFPIDFMRRQAQEGEMRNVFLAMLCVSLPIATFVALYVFHGKRFEKVVEDMSEM